MKNNRWVVLIINLVISMLLFLTVIALALVLTPLKGEVRAAVSKCEAELPRHLTCDYKIVAFVKEENS